MYHEAAKTVEDVIAYVPKDLGLTTKNLFLKAKKPHDASDSGLRGVRHHGGREEADQRTMRVIAR